MRSTVYNKGSRAVTMVSPNLEIDGTPVPATHPLQFPHHTFAPDEIRGLCEIVPAKSATISIDPLTGVLPRPSELLRRSGVQSIVLIHGTFAGNDIAGLVREIARFSPVSARRLRELSKHWFDELIGEVGNYTQAYADCLSKLINTGDTPIPVHCFQWSGENHHLGRADGVMSLIETIDGLAETHGPGGRILTMAHSHGGNLLAMLSQIVGSDRATVEAFFEQTKLHYHSPIRGKSDLQAWLRVKERLLASRSFPAIDVATFGTPLRYRWNRNVCPSLLHFVQHRSLDPSAPTKAVFPRSMQELYDAVAGDYVQHLGIAGTDFLPSVFAWRDWVVEHRMQRMFESTARRRDLWKKLMIGRRESCDGITLLIDYSLDDNEWYRKLIGHGVYTCRQWLPFHLHEITERFYA